MITLTLLVATGLAAQEAQQPMDVERDDTTVERSATLRILPEVLTDPNGDGVLHVSADDVVLDFGGGHLRGASRGARPDSYEGIGLRVTGRNVQIRNARISGYRVAVWATDADGLLLEDCDLGDNRRQRLGSAADTVDPDDQLQPYENDANEWLERYGAAVYVEDTSVVTIRGCRGHKGQNGIVLDRCDQARIYDNDFSFLSGWGIALWRSSDNLISRNAFDFCVRGYSHGNYNLGQGSAGILLVEQSSRNVLYENSATHGGAGMLVLAGREALGATPPPREGFDHTGVGCNDNLIIGNDLSEAATHGLELAFSFDNLVVDNRVAENGSCGVRADHSQRTAIIGNQFVRNGGLGRGLELAAVSIGHGSSNQIGENQFFENVCGVQLWWHADEDPAATRWVEANGSACDLNIIQDNNFRHDQIGIRLRWVGQTWLHENRMMEVGVELDVEPPGVDMSNDAHAQIVQRPDTLVLGETRPIGSNLAHAGRDRIVMTEWGPYGFETPLLRFKGTVMESGAPLHLWTVLGAAAPGPPRATGDVKVSQRTEEILVRDGDAWADGFTGALLPYSLALTADRSTLEGRGALLSARWAVQAFPWSVDPREDVEGWRSEAAAAPTVTLPTVNLPFGSLGPSHFPWVPAELAHRELPHDRFGVVARTTVEVPIGRWRIVARSDDGLRLWLDGELAIDAWGTGPQRHTTDLVAEAPRTVELRLEYFELDGTATLELEAEPLE